MKKLLVLFVVLAVASSAFAADFSFSWDTDFGWTMGEDGVGSTYNEKINESELAVSAVVDEYNSFSTQIEGGTEADIAGSGSYMTTLQFNWMKLTTDLGAYFGLPVGLKWTNGYFDTGDQEYADFGNVGNQYSDYAGGTYKDIMTELAFDFGVIGLEIASNWDVTGAENDGDTTDKNYFVSVYSAETLVPGLWIEANYHIKDDGAAVAPVEASIIDVQAKYAYAIDDAMTLTVGGEFGTDSDADGAGTEQALGAAVMIDYMVSEDLTVDASVSFAGDDDESFRVLGGGVSAYTAMYGADVDFNYAVAATADVDEDGVAADGDLLGVDLSGYMKVGAAKFRLGYAVTSFGWSNNNTSAMPVNGGTYMRVECDF
jgi:hypothetical protein